MLAVVGTGRSRLDLADHLVLLVNIDRELEAEVTLAVLLGPGRLGILLPSLNRSPVRRRGALANEFLLFLAQVLSGSRHQGRVMIWPPRAIKPFANN